MDAELLLHRREVLSETAFVERVLWLLPRELPGSRHKFKYRLALIVNGECVMRYDNEAGKATTGTSATGKSGTRSPASTSSSLIFATTSKGSWDEDLQHQD